MTPFSIPKDKEVPEGYEVVMETPTSKLILPKGIKRPGDGKGLFDRRT